MAFSTLEIFIGFISVVVAIYYYLTATYNFWKLRGVPGPKPILVFGTIKDIILTKFSFGCYLRNIYNEYHDEPMVGIYARREPVLVLNDVDLIKNILIKDFGSFTDRGIDFNEQHEPLTVHLFNLEPKRWRPLRTKLTPVFTSGKLREMFYLLIQCADQLNKYLDHVDGQIVDMREISAKFTTDVIGVCAFGLQANALSDENSTFRLMGKRIFNFNLKNILRFRFRSFAPILYKYVGGFMVDDVLNNFFINLTRDTMEYRKQNNINRHDFIDLLRHLKEDPNQLGDMELTDNLWAAQLFVFFIAGFETSSSTMSNCLFELAMNHDIQDKLRSEIIEALEQTNGEITYDSVKDMKYLDKTVKETLRKYPPVTSIMRKSTAAYTFPVTKITIPIGTKVWIPIFGIQRDPKYFPNPDVFDPERFNDEAVKSRPSMSFLSFGDGPRNCIGARFGSMQTKVGLVKILNKYAVDICNKTDKEYKINPRGFLLTPKNGVYLKVNKTCN